MLPLSSSPGILPGFLPLRSRFAYAPTRRLYSLVSIACTISLGLAVIYMSYQKCPVNEIIQEIPLLREFSADEFMPIVKGSAIRSQIFEPQFLDMTEKESELLKNVDNPDIRQKEIGNLLRLFKKSHENFAAVSKFQSGPHNSPATALQTKLEYDTLRKSLFPHVKEAVFNPATYSGAGIVICMGSRNRKSIVHGISTLLALRIVLNCTLPVEVFHLGKDDPINDKDRAKLFSIENVVIRDLTQYTINNEKAGMGGWDMKPFAILASSFRHALMMVIRQLSKKKDADTVFLQNPEVLLDSPKYQQSGTLFFHDRRMCKCRNVNN
jgi:hypothetical protein